MNGWETVLSTPGGFGATIPASTLHEMHRLVSGHPGVITPLHVGEPHIGISPPVATALAEAVARGRTGYTDAPGLPALREALFGRLAGKGVASPDLVFVTPGSCQAIAAVLLSIAVPGRAVLLPEIHWPTHLQQVRLAGLVPRFLSAPGPQRSLATILESAYRPDVLAVIVNSPANPSGRVLSETEATVLHEWAVRHQVWVISDDAYEDFVFLGSSPSLARYDLELPEDRRVVFTVATFSKGYSMTGCRLGYVAAPSVATAAVLRRVQEALLIAPSTPVQYAGLAALDHPGHLEAHHRYVRETFEAALPVLARADLLWSWPGGGWYALLDLSGAVSDSDRFCRQLLSDTGVGLAPGHGFVPPGSDLGRRLVRIALCGERDATVAAIDTIVDYLTRQEVGAR